jgi:hypothetical protein
MSKHERIEDNSEQITVADLMQRLQHEANAPATTELSITEEAVSTEIDLLASAETEAPERKRGIFRRMGARAVEMVQDTKRFVKERKIGRKVVASVAATLAFGIPMANNAANAANVYVGGTGNSVSAGGEQFGVNDSFHRTNYPAAFIPGAMGNMTEKASISVGRENVNRVTASDAHNTYIGFSQGAAVATAAAYDAIKAGKSATVIGYGGGETGVGTVLQQELPALKSVIDVKPYLSDADPVVRTAKAEGRLTYEAICGKYDMACDAGGAKVAVKAIKSGDFATAVINAANPLLAYTGIGNYQGVHNTTYRADEAPTHATYNHDAGITQSWVEREVPVIAAMKQNNVPLDPNVEKAIRDLSYTNADPARVQAYLESNPSLDKTLFTAGIDLAADAGKKYLPGHVANEHVEPLKNAIDFGTQMLKGSLTAPNNAQLQWTAGSVQHQAPVQNQAPVAPVEVASPAPAPAAAAEAPVMYQPPAAAVSMVEQAYQAVQPAYVAPAPAFNQQTINDTAAAAKSAGLNAQHVDMVAGFASQLAGLSSQTH